ncbi:MAG: MCP four helix bundle domain-containing protein [Chthoniobacterales bacterium]
MKTTRINWGGWLILAVCLAVIGLISAMTVSLTKKEANQVARAYVPKMVAISLANKSLSQAFNETLQAVLAQDPRMRQELMASVSVQSEKTTGHLEDFGRLASDAEERQRLDALLAARQEYFAVRDRVFAQLAAGDRAAAEQLYQSALRPAYAGYEKLSVKLLQSNAGDAIDRSQAVVNRALVLQVVVAVVSAVLFLLGFGLGLFTGIHTSRDR